MIKIDHSLTAQNLEKAAGAVFEASAPKIRALQKRWKDSDGTPVFTIGGRYTSRGWTEWTQGFQFGAAILQFDATGDEEMLRIGREGTLRLMAPHVTHVGVHDHGFNNVSTYGNLRRLLREGRLPADAWEGHFYDLALNSSGAVQAARWTQISPELGYVYSFNGPHSLFSDTIRTMRALAVAHLLGHRLMAENDKAVVAEVCEYVGTDGRRFLTEERRLTFRADGETRSIDFEQDLIATDGDVRFEDKKDAGLSIRVPASMAVDAKLGGAIVNSDGAADKDAWSKAAKWCDYNGPVEGEHLGIAFLNHPSSFRYPTRWHVRTYGLFTANPFAQNQFNKELPDGGIDLKKGDRLKLRHRFVFHAGDEKAAKIQEAFEVYAKEAR
jgi:hypothetical protein